MTPRVFISSTVRDLGHVRHAIRDLVLEMGFQPVMSEFGEVAYSPEGTAALSCLEEAATCDLGVLIVGKRYGDRLPDGRSVTHAEFLKLRAAQRPVICLVEKAVRAYKEVFEKNKDHALQWPDMDDAHRTFALITEIESNPTNNGTHDFANINEARRAVQQQLGHLFGLLLRRNFNPLQKDIKDIAAELASLRDEIRQGRASPQSNHFLRASRQLLEDRYSHLRALLEKLCGSFDVAVHRILDIGTFEECVQASGKAVVVTDEVPVFGADREEPKARFAQMWDMLQPDGTVARKHCVVTVEEVRLNQDALILFNAQYVAIRAAAAD